MKIMATGTFDLLHPGHGVYLQESKNLGGKNAKLYVVVARDLTVEKRKRIPIIGEKQRLELIKMLKPVDEAYLGNEHGDFLKIVEKIKPDMITIGADQNHNIDKLQSMLNDKGLNIKSVQKAVDEKYTSYKQATVQNLDIDLIESENVYYLKVAVPGIPKEDISIEAGDNDITIETTFDAYINEFTEDEAAKEIASSLKKGKCVKTVRFESSINIEEISAKFNNGTVIITIPKLIIPKHKVNVE